jgi:hypothetical protein
MEQSYRLFVSGMTKRRRPLLLIAFSEWSVGLRNAVPEKVGDGSSGAVFLSAAIKGELSR